MNPYKTSSVVTFSIFTLFFIACYSPSNSPEQSSRFPPAKPAEESNLLTQTQVDSLQLLSGNAIPPSLWIKLFDEPFEQIPVSVLSGNLDQDPEEELAFWYYFEAIHPMGELCLLDPKPSGWKKIGTEFLDFCRGTSPPSLDVDQRMLRTYSYGTGSGYGSEVLNFYQIHYDTLVCVFRLLEAEGVYIPDCGAYRTIQASYRFKDAGRIMATYNYKVTAGEETRYPGKVVFEKKLRIPFDWDSTKNRFAPRFPEGFPALNSTESYLDEGESSFDPFYAPILEKLKWQGPLWIREALGNPHKN